MIKPIGNNILLKKVLKDDKSKGGIILSAKKEEFQNIGEVIEVGSDVKNITKGMKVIFEKYKENEFINHDEQLMIIDAKHILATICE